MLSHPGIGLNELLHELFEQQARTNPRRIAVICAAAELTYAELEQQANQLARWLRLRGVGCGDSVGLLLPRSLDVYVALLAILKAGAAYVPLDAEYPPERLSFMLADCQARVLVTTRALATTAGDLAGQVVSLDEQQSALGLLPADG